MRKATTLLALALSTAPVAAQPGTTSFSAGLMSAVIRTKDPQGEAAFYKDILGMTVAMSRDLRDSHETMLVFGDDPTRPGIMLLSHASSLPVPSQVPGLGTLRLILHVSDLGVVTERMNAAGIAHPPIADVEKGLRVLLIKDPDQNELELVQGNIGR